MAVRYFIETGPEPTDVVHEAAQIRTMSTGMSVYAVALCGAVFELDDSWVVGFGPDESAHRVTCPKCQHLGQHTQQLVIEESSLITF